MKGSFPMREENMLDFTKCGVQLFVSNPVGNLPAVLLSSFFLIHRRIRHLKQSGKFFISCGIEHGANTHTEGILGKGQHNAFRPTAQQSIQQAGQLLFLNIRQENQEFIPAEPAAKAVRRHGIPNARRHLMNNPITKDMTVGIIDMLKVINVENNQGAMAVGLCQLSLNLLLNRRLIQQPGQLVSIPFLPQMLGLKRLPQPEF